MFNFNKKIKVYYTDHFVNYTVTQMLAKSNNLTFEPIANYIENENTIFCTYGIKRGTSEILQKCKNYIFLDQGYMNASSREFRDGRAMLKKFDGYFRIIKNDLYFNKLNLDKDPTRFNALGINLKDLNQNGEYILLSEPSQNTINFLGIKNWISETIELIKKNSDRNIITHNKYSKISLNDALRNAYAFVSCQSTAAFKSISMGVPAYFTHPSMSVHGEISKINNRNLNHEFLYIAANNQWKLNEFFSDEFKNFLNRIH